MHSTQQSKTPISIPEFAEMFQRYTARTDGKDLLADAIKAACPPGGTLFDLGAGDGQLTSRISAHFDRVIAVEKNDKFRSKLEAIPNTSVHIGMMEDSLPEAKFDVAVLSYSLTGVPSAKSADFLNRLMQLSNPGGKIFFATFQDGCDWDEYVTPIYAQIGRARSGGTQVHIDIVEQAGFTAERVAKIDTELFDQNLAELSHTLGFFFAPAHAEYFNKLDLHRQSLQKFVKTSRHGGLALSCVEELWEIKG